MNARRSPRVMDVPNREPLSEQAAAASSSSLLYDGSSSSDVKLSPTALLQAGRRSLQQLEQSPSEASFYDGGCPVKSDEPPAASSSWHCGGGASASESTRESGDDGDAMEQGAMSSSESRIGSGGGRHVCTICGTSFTMLGNLNRHKKSHMNVRPYNCNFCTRGFLRRTSYVEHVRLHTGEKPYSCTACGQSFVRKKCFQTHAKCCPGGADACLGLLPQAEGAAAAGDGDPHSGGDYATAAQMLALADGRCGTGSTATAAASSSVDVAVALSLASASIAAEPGMVRQHASAAVTPCISSSAALHGGRFFGAKSLARHQPGIGRTSFSIMKKARSAQLSRWKKQHFGGLARPLAASAGTIAASAVTATVAGVTGRRGGHDPLSSRRAVIEGHRRHALHMQPSRLGSGGGGNKLTEQQRAGKAAARSAASGLVGAPGLSPSHVSAAGGLPSQNLCCPAAIATTSGVGAEQLFGGSVSVGGRRSVSPSSFTVTVASTTTAAAAAMAALPLQGLLCSPSGSASAAASQRSPSAGALGTALTAAAMAAAQPLQLLVAGSSASGPGRAASPASGRSPAAAASADPATPLAGLPRDVKLFHCRHCDIYFANLVTFLLHRGLHGEGDPLKCSICGKVCRDANEFLIHH